MKIYSTVVALVYFSFHFSPLIAFLIKKNNRLAFNGQFWEQSLTMNYVGHLEQGSLLLFSFRIPLFLVE